MFEIAEYSHPHIFVRSRRTGETYRFLVGDDGALAHEGTSFDQGEPRRIPTLAAAWRLLSMLEIAV